MFKQLPKLSKQLLRPDTLKRAAHAMVAMTLLVSSLVLSPDSAAVNVGDDDATAVDAEEEPNPDSMTVQLSQEEQELLARLVRAEAEGEPYVGKVAVAAVVLNRLEHPDFPDTVTQIIYQPSQFEPVLNGTINLPARPVDRQAVQDALQGWDPSDGALYIFNPEKTRNAFVWSRRPIKMIANHRFTS